jgi:hypothetical protein
MSKISRNDPCPCGSARKYKNCCLETDEARLRVQRHASNAASYAEAQSADAQFEKVMERGESTIEAA